MLAVFVQYADQRSSPSPLDSLPLVHSASPSQSALSGDPSRRQRDDEELKRWKERRRRRRRGFESSNEDGEDEEGGRARGLWRSRQPS